ncbi:MAG: uncharacterized protein KVP18_004827 [Porospora cf. gigantea A]|uniref:uncharacterized protein n=1 Tax=Porospora cf. gigantea A TaxID=2853593 RepID=UPI00355AAF07|nr:MAG: hypothetical protein KVP18_004827 [Porospora cf. gigantea A]
MFFDTCDLYLADLPSDQEIPKAYRDYKILHACALTCGSCEELGLLLPGEPCINNAQFEETASCVEVTRAYSCETLLAELAEASGSPVPEHVPKGTRVKNVCVQSCGLCPEAGECLDSPMVSEDWKTSCQDLLLYDHCDTPLKNAYFFSLRPFPSWFDQDVQVKSVCRKSCDACEAATSGLECRDAAASASLSESCLNLLRSNCCNKTLDSLDNVFASPEVPGSTLIRDLCPATCGLCLVGSAVEDCGDSPLVAGFGVGCSELAVLGSHGCLTRMAEFARFITDEAALNMLDVVGQKQLRAVCLEHCGACQQPTCVDGFVNGQEVDVDCGGPCRPCSSCNPSGLKPLHSHFRLDGTGLQHGSTRLLSCRGTAVLETPDVNQSISCRDGSWTEPQIVCKEATLETNAVTLYFIGAAGVSQLGQDFFDFTSDVVTSDLQNSRVVRGGSCDVVAMQSQRWVCEDQKQLQELGVTCGLLKMMGCSKQLDVIAKQQSVSLPSTISPGAVVADVCPVTCDDCEAARSRFYEMSPTSFRWIPGRCFQLDLFIDDTAARQLQTSSTRLFGQWLMRAQMSGLSALVFHQESMEISAPSASDLFQSGKVHAGEVAWSLSITPAVVTAEEWHSLDHGGNYMQPQSLFYPSVGKFRTGDVFDPDKLVTRSFNTRFLLLPHATAAASGLQGVCEDPYAPHSCCGLRQALLDFLDTPCGLFLYRGTLEQASFHSWCHSDCYSAAVEVVDRWSECDVQSSALELVAAWCSQSGASIWAHIADVRGLVYMENVLASATFRDLIDNSPAVGDYCMPSFLTESIPVDTLELISVDKAMLASHCGANSCTRHRLRYEFSRAQLNVAFIGEGTADVGPASAVLGRDADEILDASCHAECESELVSLRTQTNLNGCTTCQSSMLLLQNQLPNLNRDLVEVSCEDKCYKAVTGAFGAAMEYYGRLLRYPLHVVQGVTLRAAARVLCLQNTSGYFCGDFLRSANGVLEFETGDPASPCSQTCDGDFKGDGFCDLGCFNAECHWDDRDCLAANIVPSTFANLKGLVLATCDPFEEAFSCSKECALAMDNRLQGCCQVYLLEMLRLLKLADSEHPLYIGDAQLNWSPSQVDGLCERTWLSDCRASTRTVLVPVSTSGSLGETTRGLVAYFRLVDGDVLAVVDRQTFRDVELNVDLRPEDIDLPRLEAFLAASVGTAVDIPVEGVMLKLSAECDPQRLSTYFPESNYLIDPTGMISCAPEAISEGAARGAVSCTAGRWVSVPAVVCRRPCPPFEPGSGMVAVSTNDFAVQVKCGEGYTSLMVNEILRCRDGVWDLPRLQCVTLCDDFDVS